MALTRKELDRAMTGNRLALDKLYTGAVAADVLAEAFNFSGTNTDVVELINGAMHVVGEVSAGKIAKGIYIGSGSTIFGQIALRGSVSGDYTVSEALFGFHGFEDYTLVNMSGTKNAYASLAISAATTGSSNYDHFTAVQAWAGHTSSGTMAAFTGVDVYSQITGGVTTDNIGVRVRGPAGTGTITNNYGIYIDEQGRGSSKDYAIYSAGNAPSLHKGDITFGTSNCTSHIITFTKKYLYFSDSVSAFGDSGLVAGGAANGHTTIQYYEANTLTIKRGTITVATFGGDGSVTIAGLAGTGSRTVVADANGKLSAP